MVTNHNPAPLIKVEQQDGRQVVSARELYDFLGFDKSQWSRWYPKNILDNQFAIEGEDWVGFDIKSNHNATKDFALSIDFAKRLSMMAKTAQGEMARQYFIECEKKATALPTKSLLESLSEGFAQMAKLERQQLEQSEELLAISEKQVESQLYVEQVAKEPVQTLQVTVRKALDSLLKNYAIANNLSVAQLYGMVYQQFALRYRKNVKSNAFKAGMTQISWLEANGYISEAYEVAKELFAQKGGICA